jgi:hypothetical protein
MLQLDASLLLKAYYIGLCRLVPFVHKLEAAKYSLYVCPKG